MKTFEQKLENLNACINNGNPKWTPCLLFVNFPLISDLTGVSSREYFSDAKIMMDSQIETYSKLGTDGPISPDFGTVVEASALGGEVVYDNAGIPSIHVSPDSDIETLAQLKPADPRTSGMMKKALTFLEYMVAHAPSGIRVASTNTMAPMTAAATLRGISDFCMDTIEEPELVEQLLDTVTKTEIEYLAAQREILGDSFDRVFLSDDISSFFSDAQFRQFVLPTYTRIYGAFPGAQRWLHNDGASTHIAAAIAEAGVQLWHIGKCVDMAEIFRLTENKIALCGNLDPIEDLLNGTEQSVYDCACQEIARFKHSGKHICSTGGFLGYGTPIKNIKAMIKATEVEN